jgi:hypothetical protein
MKTREEEETRKPTKDRSKPETKKPAQSELPGFLHHGFFFYHTTFHFALNNSRDCRISLSLNQPKTSHTQVKLTAQVANTSQKHEHAFKQVRANH